MVQFITIIKNLKSNIKGIKDVLTGWYLINLIQYQTININKIKWTNEIGI